MTLTEAAMMTKKAMIVGGITFVVLIFGWLGYQYWYYQVYLPSRPKIEEKPTETYGNLPKLFIKQNIASSSIYNYTLDTDTGSLPAGTPKLFKVYSVAQLATDLLALDRAKNLAGLIGFNRGSQAVSATQYNFFDETGGKLTINLDTGNFVMQRPISTASAQLENRDNFLNSDKIAEDFKSYLSGKALLKDDLRNGRIKVQYDRSTPDPNKAIINIWQQDVDKTPIVTPTFTEGLVKGMVTNFQDEVRRYVYLSYTFWPIDLKNSSTYPLKTPDEAFSALQKGDSMVPVSTAKSGDKVSITKIYLAYFLSDEYTPYLQPVYVFEGPNFTAYVQAIKDEVIDNTNSATTTQSSTSTSLPLNKPSASGSATLPKPSASSLPKPSTPTSLPLK